MPPGRTSSSSYVLPHGSPSPPAPLSARTWPTSLINFSRHTRMIYVDKGSIKALADEYIANYKLEEYDLAGWEWLHGFLRKHELALIRGACEIQRYLSHIWELKMWAYARASWLKVGGLRGGNYGVDWLQVYGVQAVFKSRSAFIKLGFVVQQLLVWTRLRKQCQFWIICAYLRKMFSNGNTQPTDAELTRIANFPKAMEYSFWRPFNQSLDPEWFQLHNLALDQVSAIRAVMDQSVSLFPAEMNE
ncbi:hypothetical protein N0V83_007653 [Neocucurbitaria cava]|uniref:Uncharacterized protein n=1 Tax=Neocucurbitaria cava TaxID=798079 RepID=A0A9W8Y4Q0_9PLEO|nr:hypothetical protein N0V83_007653 [Neocucurbitaria cava]